MSSEESSYEEEISIQQTMELRLAGAKKFQVFYVVLYGATLFYYKDASAENPKGMVDLSPDHEVNQSEFKKKDNVFSVTLCDEEVISGSVATQRELNEWIAIIEFNKELETTNAPDRSGSKKKKGSAMKRAKKKAVQKSATSGLGKKIMKMVVNDETTKILHALKAIVKKDTGSSKRAEEIEKNLIKLMVKTVLLIEDKKLTPHQFIVVDRPLRQAFSILLTCFNGKDNVQPEDLLEALHKVELMMRTAQDQLTTLLESQLKAKNVMLIASTFALLADAEFLHRTIMDDSLTLEMERLVEAMEFYTYFHYR
eukprot:TRINITY_DN228_c0_g1_i1.p1 TRINITY_DN228_c0_g1~~TRINITY_DN228_c0_g1_i1.p1  ORF type:complete len:327 (-),score=62.74 TRINITY_DN228_c0_g1_i1:132-1064(-)